MDAFTDLTAWKVGLDLVDEVYKLTIRFPKQEMFGLVSQMRRASTSVLANLAEGFGRYTYPDKANKYTIARGECSEIEAFLHIVVRLAFVRPEEAFLAFSLVRHEKKLLSGLISSCRRRA